MEEEVVVLTLTTRGPLEPSKTDLHAVIEGLNLGRDTIVRSFRGLMTDKANEYWGLTHAID